MANTTNTELSYANRCLRIRSGKLLFGPTGKRLFVDYLEKEPGFCGRIDFIHKTNITSLFRVRCDAADSFDAAETVWYPEKLTMELENSRIIFSETKFITEDDCAVSCQRWTNKSSLPFKLTIEAQAELCEASADKRTGALTLISPMTRHGYSVGIAVKTDIRLEYEPYVLQPGCTVEFTAAAAAGDIEQDGMDAIIGKVCAFFAEGTDYPARHHENYRRFFDAAPSFISSDAVLDTAWNYRWFLLRHCLAEPSRGYLRGAVMYEGRSHKCGSEPLAPKGWEFSKLINLSTPLHLTDMRWHSDRQTAREMILNMINNLDENGIFCSAYVDERLHSYANYGVWAVYKLWQTDGCDAFIREILDRLKSYVKSETCTYGGDDYLQTETRHNRTGKEYQPSYWYFHKYPKDPKDPATYTPLKRVDRSVYHYLNVLGLARLCRALGDADADAYQREAEKIKKAVLNKMWDGETGFFYDLHHQTDEKAMVKNIVGIYPYWADITDEAFLKGLELLFDEKHFKTPCPFPSVSRECEAYRPEGGWMGSFIKGRNGCVWCGPSWPYTTGIAIDAIGLQSAKFGHRYDAEFARCLREYSLQHFRDRDIRKPYLVEHYNAETGEPLSDDTDYNHSYFIDLVITHVAGVKLTEDGIVFDPADMGLDFFILDNLNIRGDIYTVSYRSAACSDDGYAKGLPEGYCVRKNGELLRGRQWPDC